MAEKNKWCRRCFIVSMVILSGVLIYLYIPRYVFIEDMQNVNFIEDMQNFTSIPKEPPIIFYYEKHPANWFKVFNISKRCPNKCIFTSDIKMYNKSSAVIFFRTLFKPPPPKLQNQTWIYMTFESHRHVHLPVNQDPWTHILDKFDMIMSYRATSAVQVPFGIIKRVSNESLPNLNFTLIYYTKDREAAWLVSDCRTNSKREDYIRELKKYISVDVYGGCGKLNCPAKSMKAVVASFTACKSYISKRYKFYLAFENSLCDNYSSEKLYGVYDSRNFMIPVVRGDPKVAQHFPNGTFISSNNFSSPKNLAYYLKYIGSSKDLYTQFLKEKLKYNVTMWEENYVNSICQLCNKLIKGNGKLPRKKDFNFIEELLEDKCYKPIDIIK